MSTATSDPLLNLSAAVMDAIEDLPPGREIRINRTEDGRVFVTAPDGRVASALRAAFGAEAPCAVEVAR